YDTLSRDDLRVSHLVRTQSLAKSSSDAGWAQFRSLLEARAADAGRHVAPCHLRSPARTVAAVGRAGTKSLSVRTPVCTHCGLILERDLNAAKAIHGRGQRRRGVPALAGALHRAPVGPEPRRRVSYHLGHKLQPQN